MKIYINIIYAVALIGGLTLFLSCSSDDYPASDSGTPSLMTSFLVNLEFKKYYKIPYPVHFSCVGDRVYSIEEFIEEVLTAII